MNDTLKTALEAREKEYADYQTNIDNYRLALKHESMGDDDMQEFNRQLKELLRTSLIEQKKCKVMWDVIRGQIE